MRSHTTSRERFISNFSIDAVNSGGKASVGNTTGFSKCVSAKLHDARHKVTQPVGQVGIVGVFKGFAGYVTVIKWRNVASQKVADCIGAILS